MNEYIQFIFPRTIFRSKIFRSGIIRTFSIVWCTKNNFLTELKSPISAVQFSFATIFQYIKISSDFAHISNLGFPIDLAYNSANRLLICFFFEK